MSRKRNLYLKTIPVEEAKEKYFERVREIIQPKSETIKVIDSLGRVTKKATYARYSSPLFNASAMDGISVKASDTDSASETSPVILREDQYTVVDTGDPVHAPHDAVIMAEDIVETEGGVRITASASAGIFRSGCSSLSSRPIPAPPVPMAAPAWGWLSAKIWCG